MTQTHSALSVALITIALTMLVRACGAEPHLPSGIKALPSAAPKGRGPLALVNLNLQVLGHARVFGEKVPDLFVAGYGGPQKVYLFRWLDTAETGAPVQDRRPRAHRDSRW